MMLLSARSLISLALLAVSASADQQVFTSPAAEESLSTSFPGHTLLKLNNGELLPSPAFGVGSAWFRKDATDAVVAALKVGYRHIDNAAVYGNEEFVGEALRTAGIPRSELFITSKFDNLDGADVETEFQASLTKLGVSYLDLYLTHFPQVGKPASKVWPALESLVERGLVKSIGVSNYDVSDLEEILALPGLKVKPSVNQIRYHPYNTIEQRHPFWFANQHEIVTQSYSALTPLTKEPGGPVSDVVKQIAEERGITEAQVILDWVKQKGIASVTTSGNPAHQVEQLAVFASDFPKLTAVELKKIEIAGLKRQKTTAVKVDAVN